MMLGTTTQVYPTTFLFTTVRLRYALGVSIFLLYRKKIDRIIASLSEYTNFLNPYTQT